MSPAAPWLPQFGRFVLVGALCTALHYLLLAAAVEWAGMQVVVASSIGYAASAAVNYLLNRRFTFESQRAHAALLGRYVAVLAAGLLLNALVMLMLHDYLRWHYLLAQIIATGLALLWNFSAHRFWTFSRSL